MKESNMNCKSGKNPLAKKKEKTYFCAYRSYHFHLICSTVTGYTIIFSAGNILQLENETFPLSLPQDTRDTLLISLYSIFEDEMKTKKGKQRIILRDKMESKSNHGGINKNLKKKLNILHKENASKK